MDEMAWADVGGVGSAVAPGAWCTDGYPLCRDLETKINSVIQQT